MAKRDREGMRSDSAAFSCVMLGLDPSISETSAFSSRDARVEPEHDGDYGFGTGSGSAEKPRNTMSGEEVLWRE